MADQNDDVILTVGGKELTGWEDVEITLRAEGFPNSFEISLSSREPITNNATVAKAGDECRVMIGSDAVITGYIDRDVIEVGPSRHELHISGRGKTQDLVDCSAEWETGQLINGNALDIAKKLCQPYGISVRMGEGADPGPTVPATCLNYSDRAADIIQRAARNAGLLAYEDSDGKLVLADLGKTKAASGIKYGENLQSATVTNSMDQRYSEIICRNMGMDAWGDLSGQDFFDIEKDPNVPRHRRMNMVLEQVADQPQEFTIKKAKWEVARRAARGSIVQATVDSWRDKGGKLWAPNTLIPVTVPGLRLSDTMLAISEVTFRKSDQEGTTAAIVCMPQFGFKPEPISLLPLNSAEVPALGDQ